MTPLKELIKTNEMRDITITEDYKPTQYAVPFSNENNGYPMYFKTDIKGDIIICDLCHNQPIDVGYIIALRNGLSSFIIDEILEQRSPVKNGKNHHPKGVLFYKVKGEFVKFLN